MPLRRGDIQGDVSLTISASSALKYAVSKAIIWSYPRSVVYGFIEREAKVTDAPFSKEVIERVRALLDMRQLRGDRPVAKIARHDVEEASKALDAVDPGYDPDHLLGLTDDVNAFLEGEVGTKALRPLKLSIVDRYPHPYEKAKATAWSLSEYESQLLGMPQGVYMRRDQIFPVSAECVLGHEYGHAVILDMPNYIPWFDEGLADVLGYAYYASRFGKVSDLRAWINFRAELKEYGRWYAEYDRLVSVLIMVCGMDGVRALVRLKRYEPNKVDWTRLANVLRENPSYPEVRNCVQGEFPAAAPPPPLYATISGLLGSATMVYALSPEAYSVMLNLMEVGREAKDTVAFRGIPSARRRRAERELFDHNLVYRHGTTLGIFGGEAVGSAELFRSNLVRSQLKPASLRRLR